MNSCPNGQPPEQFSRLRARAWCFTAFSDLDAASLDPDAWLESCKQSWPAGTVRFAIAGVERGDCDLQ
jgi:hypothetical protein